MIADRLHVVNDWLAFDKVTEFGLQLNFVNNCFEREGFCVGKIGHDLSVDFDVRVVVVRVNEP